MTDASTGSTRGARLVRGVYAGWLTQGVTLLGSFVVIPIVVRVVGVANYGTWLMCMQALALLSLVDLGVTGLLPREVATAVPAGAEAIHKTVRAAMTLVLRQWAVVASLSSALLLAGWMLFPASLTLIVIVAAGYVATYPLRVGQAVLMGLQQYSFIAKTSLVSWIVSNGILVAWIVVSPDIEALGVSWVVGQLVSSLLWLRRVDALRPGIVRDALRLEVSTDASRGFRKRSLWVALSQVGQALSRGSDALVVGAVGGTLAAGTWGVGVKLSQVASQQAQLMVETSIPSLAELREAEGSEACLDAVSTIGLFSSAVTAFMACTVVAANHAFVEIWIGRGSSAGTLFAAAIGISMLLRNLRFVTMVALFASGEVRSTTIAGLVDGALTAAFLALGFAGFGLAGAALAPGIAALVTIVAVLRRPLLEQFGSRAFARLLPVARASGSGLAGVVVAYACAVYVPAGVAGLAIAALAGATVGVAAVVAGVGYHGLRQMAGALDHISPRAARAAARILRTGDSA